MNEFENSDSPINETQSEEVNLTYNLLDRLCCKLTVLMTCNKFLFYVKLYNDNTIALLLSLDQFINNEKYARFSFLPDESSPLKEDKDHIPKMKKDNRKLISEEALGFVIKGLMVFKYKKVHRDIK